MRLRALVWKRTDFRESSRVVTLWTRERGRIRVLAKGAHRANSAVLGKIDFLNRLDVAVSGRGMPVLGRTRLVHEPRALREPARFTAAQYLVGLFDAALLDERADLELFELAEGALTLVERAPLDRLRQILAGIELRLLAVLGQLPSPRACSQCGGALRSASSAPSGGLYCTEHAPRNATRVAPRTLARLAELVDTPGRRWPALPPSPADPDALALVGRWLAFALGDLPRWRAIALRKLRT